MAKEGKKNKGKNDAEDFLPKEPVKRERVTGKNPENVSKGPETQEEALAGLDEKVADATAQVDGMDETAEKKAGNLGGEGAVKDVQEMGEEVKEKIEEVAEKGKDELQSTELSEGEKILAELAKLKESLGAVQGELEELDIASEKKQAEMDKVSRGTVADKVNTVSDIDFENVPSTADNNAKEKNEKILAFFESKIPQKNKHKKAIIEILRRAIEGNEEIIIPIAGNYGELTISALNIRELLSENEGAYRIKNGGTFSDFINIISEYLDKKTTSTVDIETKARFQEQVKKVVEILRGKDWDPTDPNIEARSIAPELAFGPGGFDTNVIEEAFRIVNEEKKKLAQNPTTPATTAPAPATSAPAGTTSSAGTPKGPSTGAPGSTPGNIPEKFDKNKADALISKADKSRKELNALKQSSEEKKRLESTSKGLYKTTLEKKEEEWNQAKRAYVKYLIETLGEDGRIRAKEFLRTQVWNNKVEKAGIGEALMGIASASIELYDKWGNDFLDEKGNLVKNKNAWARLAKTGITMTLLGLGTYFGMGAEKRFGEATSYLGRRLSVGLSIAGLGAGAMESFSESKRAKKIIQIAMMSAGTGIALATGGLGAAGIAAVSTIVGTGISKLAARIAKTEDQLAKDIIDIKAKSKIDLATLDEDCKKLEAEIEKFDKQASTNRLLRLTASATGAMLGSYATMELYGATGNHHTNSDGQKETTQDQNEQTTKPGGHTDQPRQDAPAEQQHSKSWLASAWSYAKEALTREKTAEATDTTHSSQQPAQTTEQNTNTPPTMQTPDNTTAEGVPAPTNVSTEETDLRVVTDGPLGEASLKPETPEPAVLEHKPQTIEINEHAVVHAANPETGEGGGITYAYKQQLLDNPELCKQLGIDHSKLNNEVYSAKVTAELAIKNGYIEKVVDAEGNVDWKEVRVLKPETVAYVLTAENGEPVTTEYEVQKNATGAYTGTEVETHHKGDMFEPTSKGGIESKYEYSENKAYNYAHHQNDESVGMGLEKHDDASASTSGTAGIPDKDHPIIEPKFLGDKSTDGATGKVETPGPESTETTGHSIEELKEWPYLRDKDVLNLLDVKNPDLNTDSGRVSALLGRTYDAVYKADGDIKEFLETHPDTTVKEFLDLSDKVLHGKVEIYSSAELGKHVHEQGLKLHHEVINKALESNSGKAGMDTNIWERLKDDNMQDKWEKYHSSSRAFMSERTVNLMQTIEEIRNEQLAHDGKTIKIQPGDTIDKYLKDLTYNSVLSETDKGLHKYYFENGKNPIDKYHEPSSNKMNLSALREELNAVPKNGAGMPVVDDSKSTEIEKKYVEDKKAGFMAGKNPYNLSESGLKIVNDLHEANVEKIFHDDKTTWNTIKNSQAGTISFPKDHIVTPKESMEANIYIKYIYNLGEVTGLKTNEMPHPTSNEEYEKLALEKAARMGGGTLDKLTFQPTETIPVNLNWNTMTAGQHIYNIENAKYYSVDDGGIYKHYWEAVQRGLIKEHEYDDKLLVVLSNKLDELEKAHLIGKNAPLINQTPAVELPTSVSLEAHTFSENLLKGNANDLYFKATTGRASAEEMEAYNLLNPLSNINATGPHKFAWYGDDMKLTVGELMHKAGIQTKEPENLVPIGPKTNTPETTNELRPIDGENRPSPSGSTESLKPIKNNGTKAEETGDLKPISSGKNTPVETGGKSDILQPLGNESIKTGSGTENLKPIKGGNGDPASNTDDAIKPAGQSESKPAKAEEGGETLKPIKKKE